VGAAGELACKMFVKFAKTDIPPSGLARRRVPPREEVVQREPTSAAFDRIELGTQLVVTPSQRQVTRSKRVPSWVLLVQVTAKSVEWLVPQHPIGSQPSVQGR
jgi:hypothetical protein